MSNAMAGNATLALRLGAMICGASLGLVYLSLLVWTARDISARSRDGLVRLAAVLLVLLLNVVGLAVYVLLRPTETLAERYERELIEEVLAREVTGRARPAARLQDQNEAYRAPAGSRTGHSAP